MATKTDRRVKRTKETPRRQEQLPTWQNTRPRGNPEPDRQDLERSRERFEMLLGR